MPDLQFDEFGNLIWRPGLDPLVGEPPTGSPGAQDPAAQAAAAIAAIGQPGGIPLPQDNPLPGVGAPPDLRDPAAQLMNPVNEGVPPPFAEAFAPGSPLEGLLGLPPKTGPVPAPEVPKLDTAVSTPGTDLGAPVDPYSARTPAREGAAPLPLTTPAYGDVNAATAQERRNLEELALKAQQAERAKLESEADFVTRAVDVNTRAADERAKLDDAYIRARQAAREQSDRESADYLIELDRKSKEEVDPNRGFTSRSDFSQAMLMLSITFGSVAQAFGGENIGLKLVTDIMDRDIEAQKSRISREIDAIKAKGGVLSEKQQRRLVDLTDDHQMAAQRWHYLEQGMLLKAKMPGPAQQKAAAMAAAQQAATQKLMLAQKMADRAYVEREQKLDRGFQGWKAKLEDKRARDLAGMSAAIEMAKAKQAKQPDFGPEKYPAIHPGITGIRVVNSKGQPVGAGPGGALKVSKENEKEARELAGAANQHHAAMTRLKSHFDKGSDLETLLKQDPQFEADLKTLFYQGAKNLDPRAIVTDKDLENAGVATIGADYDSKTGRILSTSGLGANKEKIGKVLEKKIRDYPKFVGNRLGALIDPQLPGYEGEDVKIDWTPQSVEINEPGAPSAGETLATRGINEPTLVKIESTKDLETARAVGGLPPYKPKKPGEKLSPEEIANRALSDYQGAAPGRIEKMAKKDLADVRHDDRAYWEIVDARNRAKEKAESALSEVEARLKGARVVGITHTSTEWQKIAKDLAIRNELHLTPVEIKDLVDRVIPKSEAK